MLVYLLLRPGVLIVHLSHLKRVRTRVTQHRLLALRRSGPFRKRGPAQVEHRENNPRGRNKSDTWAPAAPRDHFGHKLEVGGLDLPGGRPGS